VRFVSADQTLGRRAVVYFASGQKDGEFVAFVCSAFTGLTASTPQDDTSATCAEDLFTKCVSRRPRGRRCAYLIVGSEAAAKHATTDDHGFDLANNSGITAPGACVSGQCRRLRKTAASWTPQGAKSAEAATERGSERRMAAVACKQDSFEDIALSVTI
jgi:hypothetical protein